MVVATVFRILICVCFYFSFQLNEAGIYVFCDNKGELRDSILPRPRYDDNGDPEWFPRIIGGHSVNLGEYQSIVSWMCNAMQSCYSTCHIYCFVYFLGINTVPAKGPTLLRWHTDSSIVHSDGCPLLNGPRQWPREWCTTSKWILSICVPKVAEFLSFLRRSKNLDSSDGRWHIN